MENNLTKKLANFNLKLKFVPEAETAWIFYGWAATFVISLFIIGSTVYFLQVEVNNALKNVDVITSLKQKIIYIDLNTQLFEKIKERWDAKKNLLPIPSNLRNPFFL